MPYRRLPNTDKARIRAMQIALDKYDELGDSAPYPFKVILPIRTFLPHFISAINDYQNSLEMQARCGEKYQGIIATARLYISHFVQVLNMSCIRGEIKPGLKTLYRLLPDDNSLPDLSTDRLVLEWGKNIIEGEAERQRLGGVPIYNPAIAKVKVHVDQFRDVVHERKVLKQNSERCQQKIHDMRKVADELIVNLWDSIEEGLGYASNDPARLDSSKEFGIVYYLRKEERASSAL